MQNNFLQTHFKKIVSLAIITVIVLAGFFTYLLFTQPKDAISPDKKTITIAQANPILKKIPYTDPYYQISYKTVSATSNDIIITIHTPSPRYRYYAIRELKSWGYDPTDYTIEFTDFVNPLGV